MAPKLPRMSPRFWLVAMLAVALAAFTYYWTRSIPYAMALLIGVLALFAVVRQIEAAAAGRDTGGPRRVAGKSATWTFGTTLEMPLPTAREAVLQAMYGLNRVKVLRDSDGVVEARTGVSLASFGEIVRAELVEDRGTTKVQLESRPALRTTLVDWGKNKRNLSALQRALTVRH